MITPVQISTLKKQLADGLGMNTQEANILYAKLWNDGLINDSQTFEGASAIVAREIKAQGGTPPAAPMSDDLTKAFPRDTDPAPTAQHETSEPAPQAPAKPQETQPAPKGNNGISFSMPNGGARLWRNVNGEDVEFFITADTNMAALVDNLTALLDAFPKASWIAKKESSDPANNIVEYRQFRLGETVVLGVDNRKNATPITSITISKGRTKRWINFHDGTLAKSGNNQGMPITVGKVEYSADVVKQIEQALGMGITEMDNINCHVTLRLGNLGTTDKEVNGKMATVYNDATYISNFYCDFVSITPV